MSLVDRDILWEVLFIDMTFEYEFLCLEMCSPCVLTGVGCRLGLVAGLQYLVTAANLRMLFRKLV